MKRPYQLTTSASKEVWDQMFPMSWAEAKEGAQLNPDFHLLTPAEKTLFFDLLKDNVETQGQYIAFYLFELDPSRAPDAVIAILASLWAERKFSRSATVGMVLFSRTKLSYDFLRMIISVYFSEPRSFSPGWGSLGMNELLTQDFTEAQAALLRALSSRFEDDGWKKEEGLRFLEELKINSEIDPLDDVYRSIFELMMENKLPVLKTFEEYLSPNGSPQTEDVSILNRLKNFFRKKD